MALAALSTVGIVGNPKVYAQEDCGPTQDAEDMTGEPGWVVQDCDDGQKLLTGPDGQQSWIGSQECTATDRENPEDRVIVSSC